MNVRDERFDDETLRDFDVADADVEQLPPSPETPLISYSQNAEDVRLWRVFAGTEDGFYVDFGAGDPREYSVTKLFYDRGWSGINVEPGPAFAELELARPRDINLNLAVGLTEGIREFWVSTPHSGLSSFVRPSADAPLPEGFGFERVEIPCRPAAAILDEYASNRQIDFMTIDVEGTEAEVIRSIDFQQSRPRIIVVEAIAPLTHEPSHEEWEPILIEAGYCYAAFDGINRFYTDSPEAEFFSRLAYPISPLDAFSVVERHVDGRLIEFEESNVSPGESSASLREQVEELEAENRRLAEAAASADAYRDALAAVYSSRTWRAGRLVASLATPVATTRRLVRRARAPQAASLSDAVAAAIEPGAPWHFAQGAAPKRRWRRSLLESVATDFGPVQEPLSSRRAVDLAEKLERVAWADEDALLRKRIPWDERVALAEASAVARMVAEAAGTTGEGRSETGLVVVDARCLQDPLYAGRGVGVHAAFVLEATRAVTTTGNLILLASCDLPSLPPNVAELADSVVSDIYSLRCDEIGMFLELSPMTHDAVPFAWFRQTARGVSAAVVYDFIPSSFPSAYLRTPAANLTNRARVEALRHYDLLFPISRATDEECRRILGASVRTCITHVADPLEGVPAERPMRAPFVLVPAGGDPRKNPATVLGALHLHLRDGGAPLEAVVTGALTPPQQAGLHVLAAALGFEEGAVVMLGAVPDGDFAGLCESAELAIVPSYAEGFSIPVVQAVRRGVPVVASDIAPHRELLGAGPWLAPAADAQAFARAISHVRANRERTVTDQQRALGDLAETKSVQVILTEALSPLSSKLQAPERRRRVTGRPRLAVVSPFPPQASGVADYTEYTFEHVAHYADVDIFSSAVPSTSRKFVVQPISARPYLDPRYDAVVNVLGNSHFHFPMLDLLGAYGGAAIAHDNRMFEAYRLDRGDAWVAQLLGSDESSVQPEDIDRFVADLDELPSIGYRDIAYEAHPLIVHGPTLARRIERETGVQPCVDEFVPYKVPRLPEIDDASRRQARGSLGFDDREVHVATFGIVDSRTKGCDRIVGALSWLHTWGIAARLHIVGECHKSERWTLDMLARDLGVASRVTFYGRVDASVLEQFHLAVDAAVQLRTSALLSLSGALADCMAYGIPTITTHDLAEEMGAPFYVATTDSHTSSLLVAEALLDVMHVRRSRFPEVETSRCDYLQRRSPDVYARTLLACLGLRD